MDAFELLCRRSAGSSKDRSRFKPDVNVPNVRGVPFVSEAKGKGKARKEVGNSNELPLELDFFKNKDAGGDGGSDGLKRKTNDDDDDVSEDGEDSEHGEGGSKRRRIGDSTNVPQSERISVEGVRVPPAMDSFDDLKERYQLSPHVLELLSRQDYQAPTPIQCRAVPILLEGRDLVATSPPGTGKTLCYLLPMISRLGAPISDSTDDATGIRAIVLAATRERARRIHEQFMALAAGQSWKTILLSKTNAHMLEDADVRDTTDVVVSAAHRLHECLKSGEFHLKNVRHLILDEADLLLGPEFLSQTQDIVKACTHRAVQKVVMSSELSVRLEKLALGMLRDPIRVFTGPRDAPLATITQSLTYVADESSKFPSLLAYLARPYHPPILIFTSTQPRASFLEQQLTIQDVPKVNCLGPDMTNEERTEAVRRMGRGECWVMICTEDMARGMALKGVRTVINFDFPTSVQSYMERVGWTGQGGREGAAVTYYTNDDLPYLKPIVKVLQQSGTSVPEWLKKLPERTSMKKMREMRRAQKGKSTAVTKKMPKGRNTVSGKRESRGGTKRKTKPGKVQGDDREERSGVVGDAEPRQLHRRWMRARPDRVNEAGRGS